MTNSEDKVSNSENKVLNSEDTMTNLIEIREINKLIKEQFYIPSYQRGYRWDEKQVTDLLEDVYEFMNKPNKAEGEFYCLQPIVVARKNGKCEVIDGQQRLTTIQIIQRYLGGSTYSIEYATRKGSKEYLENIVQNAKQDISAKNIDYYFMQKACLVIEEWFERKIEEKEEYTLRMDFYVTLGKSCKVIWYEVKDSTDVESIFTRLNIGKIPLTNAELIKSLFLKSAKKDADQEIIHLRQLEIAEEWDSIENHLQDDRLWYFIHPKNVNMATRIEFIFDAISGKRTQDDEFFTFRHFFDRLGNEEIADVWSEIKAYFQVIYEWYEDQELYHLIGYLTASGEGTDIVTLIKEYRTRCYKKSEFAAYIKGLIRNSLKDINLDELEYDSDNASIRKVLLLFNVLTTMKTNSMYSRFPFDSYCKNVWSLEHIHAQNAGGLNNRELWVSWIDEHIKSFREFTDEKYKKIVEELESVNKEDLTGEEFESLFEKIKKEIKDDYGIDLHSLSNLTLLDKDTNSSLSNDFFDVKRRKIIEKDRNGEFIPLCTRNVFLKYYSKNPSQIHYWSEADRTDYLDRIRIELKQYLPDGE